MNYQNIRGKKILILYTSIGLGHKSIAENIGYWLSQAGAEVRLEDILQVQSGWLVSVSARIHKFINTRLPFVWSFLYKSKWFTDISLPARVKVAAKNHARTLAVIREFNPDAVIATQTTASAIISYLKSQKLYTGLFGISFSDFHLHRYWLYDNADFYLANIAEQKEEMVELGINANKIFVCGMTLKPKPEIDEFAVRNRLGILPSEKVVLVASGSQGTGMNDKLLYELLGIEGAKVVVVCGKNNALAERLQKKFNGTNLLPLGFYSPMEELYAISHIYITKPGGLSTAEALRAHLSMLITHLLPGQEELNYDYLEGKGLIMPEPVTVHESVREELESHGFRTSLVQNPAVGEVVCGPEPLLTAVDSVLHVT